MTEQKKLKTWNWILNVIIVALLVLGVYLILDRIFGNFATNFQLILWIFGLLGAVMIKGAGLIYSLNREIGEIKVKNFHAFDKIKTDINRVKKDIKDIKELLTKRRRKK